MSREGEDDALALLDEALSDTATVLTI